jgi:hypothetical protein
MYDISFPGIADWHKSLFEKLGYMVLAYKNHEYDTTESYKICIEHLMKAIEENMKLEGTSANRLHDYQSMHNNLKVLHHHAVKDFYVKKNYSNTPKELSQEYVEKSVQESNYIGATGGKRKPSKASSKNPSKKPVKKLLKKKPSKKIIKKTVKKMPSKK